MDSLKPYVKVNVEAPVDKDVWSHYTLYGGGDLWVTSKGRRLRKNLDFLKKIAQYRRDYVSGSMTDTRQQFDAGQNSDVFTLDGLRILVKERKPISSESLVDSLKSMDVLQYIVRDNRNDEEDFWYDMPDHYGAFDYVDEKNKQKSFLLVEKIDDGVTLQDMLAEPESLTPFKRKKVELMFGNMTEDEKSELRQDLWRQHLKLMGILDQKITKFRALRPDLKGIKILRDPKPSNFVVEKIDPPKNGQRFKFWIIDQ